jgi:hypothetical protein
METQTKVYFRFQPPVDARHLYASFQVALIAAASESKWKPSEIKYRESDTDAWITFHIPMTGFDVHREALSIHRWFESKSNEGKSFIIHSFNIES